MQAARARRVLVGLLKVRQLCSVPQQAHWGTVPLRYERSPSSFVLPCLPNFFPRHFGASPDPSPGDHLNDEGQDKVDPLSLVGEELAVVANRLRAMMPAQVPALSLAASYFFQERMEGKRFRPMVPALCATKPFVVVQEVLLLMSSSLTIATPAQGLAQVVFDERRLRQQQIAEITEMIHVASLLHDDVLDHASTRRGVNSLNFLMGNKLAVLGGDFLLARASAALASLQNIEVVTMLSQVLEHLVTGEIMQMSPLPEEVTSMKYYLEKTFCKTASLLAYSCKAVAVLADQPRDVVSLAYEYGSHLGTAYQLVDDALDFTGTQESLGKPALSDIEQGIVTAPILFALREFPVMEELILRKFKRPTDRTQAVEMVRESQGIAKTYELAAEHAQKAAEAIASLPPNPDIRVQQCRRALTDLAHLATKRSK